MIKKVVIQAAGKGTRFKHLTKDKPKHLLEIAGKPFLSYLLTDLQMAGYTEMILIVGYKAECFEDFIKKYNFPVQLINQFIKVPEKYGSACPVMAAEELVGSDDFVVVAGDSLFAVDDLKKLQINDELNYIGGMPVENPEKYGVLKTDVQGYLERIIEKPKEFIGHLVNMAAYKFTPEIFEKLRMIKESARGEYELTDAINLLAAEKKVKVLAMKTWQDFGRPEDIAKIENYLKDKHY